jgi:hypothetical protein
MSNRYPERTIEDYRKAQELIHEASAAINRLGHFMRGKWSVKITDKILLFGTRSLREKLWSVASMLEDQLWSEQNIPAKEKFMFALDGDEGTE